MTFCRIFSLFLWVTFFCCNNFPFAEIFFFFPWVIFFCRDSFSFAASFFLLHDLFTFCRKHFFFFLRWKFMFCRDLFIFCREHFYFAGTFFCRDQFLFFSASIFVLPREFFFCRELFSFVLTPVDHCITILNLLPFKKTNLYYHLRKYISLFYQISPNSISIQTISQRLFLLHLLLKRKKTAAENSIMLNKLLT